MSETPSPIEAQMDQFKEETERVIDAIAEVYKESELLDNTVVPLEPFMLMQTYEMTAMASDEDSDEVPPDESSSNLVSAQWNEEDPRHFHQLTAVEQGILVGTACAAFGTTVAEMKRNEVDASMVQVGNPDMIEPDAADSQVEADPSMALTEEHYYKTGVDGIYMAKYVYKDGVVSWGVAKG